MFVCNRWSVLSLMVHTVRFMSNETTKRHELYYRASAWLHTVSLTSNWTHAHKLLTLHAVWSVDKVQRAEAYDCEGMVFDNNWCDDCFPFLPLSFQRVFCQWMIRGILAIFPLPIHKKRRTRKCNSVEIPDCHVARSGKRSFDFEQLISKNSHNKESDLKMAQRCQKEPKKPSCLFGYHGSKFYVAFMGDLEEMKPTKRLYNSVSFARKRKSNNPRVYNCWTPKKYSNPAWILWGPSIWVVIPKLPKEAGF